MQHSRTDLPEHFLPLPKQARPQQDPAEGYRLQRAGDAGYVVISGFVQSCFVVTSGGVVVVDAPPASLARWAVPRIARPTWRYPPPRCS